MKTNTIISKDGKVYSLIADYDFADDICEEVEKEFTEHLVNIGYFKGARDMEKAKQIVIDSLLNQIEQIRADVCDTLTELCDRWVDDDGNCWNTDCPFNDDVCKVMQLKEQK